MSEQYFRVLVDRYADGRTVCNCGCAYYSYTGVGRRGGKDVTDLPCCESGCSANQYRARDEIARRVIEEFNLKPNAN